MSVFKDAEQFYECVGGLLLKIKDDPEIYNAAADTGLVFQFRCTDLDAAIAIDTREGVNEVLFGDAAPAADIELSMPSELAHRFWLGELNVLRETLAGRIAYRGPLKKLMSLIPVLKPAMKKYPEHLRSVGFPGSGGGSKARRA